MCCGNEIVNSCLCSPCDRCTSCTQTNCSCDECPDNGCPVELDASCVYYNFKRNSPSNLTCLAIPNATSLKTILEAIDDKLCAINPYDFTGYFIPCLSGKYTIIDFQTFVESVDKEFCFIKNTIDNNYDYLNTGIINLNNAVALFTYPNIYDCGGIGLLSTDSITQILQKITNKICNILSTCCQDNSPDLLTLSSSSILLTTSGLKNHTLTADCKISGVAGNIMSIQPDGLYASYSAVNQLQNLTYNTGTGALTISSGNTVTIPLSPAQTLAFNCTSKILTISGGNTVDLTCLSGGGSFTETSLLAIDTDTIDFTTSGTSNHIITGSVKIPGLISGTSGNQLTNSSGLFVPASTDEKVKVRSADTTPGYLEDKIIGLVNTLISTTVSTNTGTNKSEVNSVLDVAALLALLLSNGTYNTTFCNLVKGCLCYTFRIANTSGSATTYNYVDCSGVTHSGMALAGNTFTDVCGRSVSTSLITTIVSNLGTC